MEHAYSSYLVGCWGPNSIMALSLDPWLAGDATASPRAVMWQNDVEDREGSDCSFCHFLSTIFANGQMA